MINRPCTYFISLEIRTQLVPNTTVYTSILVYTFYMVPTFNK